MRKKEKMQSNAKQVVDDSMEVSQDFRCQRRFWNLTVSEYKNLDEFSNLQKELDDRLNTIATGNAELDDCNENLLDTLIADAARKNVIYIRRQAAERIETIKHIISQAQGEKESYELHLQSIEEKYAKMKEKYEKLMAQYEKCTYKY